jgi:hypothetical protein
MERTPEEQTAQDLKALGDSVTVIEETLALAEKTAKDLDTIARNVEHIELMLGKEHIANSGADLKPFQAVVAKAKK